MMYFEFLEFLVKNRKKGKTRKTGHYGPLCRSEGHPRRGVALDSSEGCLTAVRPKGHKGPSPRVRQGVALLRRGEVLRPDEVTVHNGQFSNFLFLNTSFLYPDSLRTLIND